MQQLPDARQSGPVVLTPVELLADNAGAEVPTKSSSLGQQLISKGSLWPNPTGNKWEHYQQVRLDKLTLQPPCGSISVRHRALVWDLGSVGSDT